MDQMAERMDGKPVTHLSIKEQRDIFIKFSKEYPGNKLFSGLARKTTSELKRRTRKP